MVKSELMMVSGKRKTSIAKARVVSGKGEVFINNVPYENLEMFHKLAIEEPMKIVEEVIGKVDFDIYVKTKGGGREGQIQAARLALARAIIKKTKSEKLRKAFSDYDKHLLVADVRRKEAYKPDDSKARAKRQSSKR